MFTIHDWTAIQIGFAVCIVIIAVLGIVADWFYQADKTARRDYDRMVKRYDEALQALRENDIIRIDGTWKRTPWKQTSDVETRLRQRIFDLEAEREKFAKEANKYYQIWKDLAGQPVMNERDQFLDIIRHCYDRAKAHQSKERTGRLRNGAEACRWIAESMQSVIDRYGKEATPSHEINAHG